jgi:hypothetical protein
MSEQSQSAKFRRGVLRRLPRSLVARFPLNPAERAALALAQAAKAQPNGPLTTTFAIPLVGAHQVRDWSVIESTLTRTLTTLIGQSDPNWRAVICSQTRPATVDLDPRISHLPFTQEVAGHDKVAKLQHLARHCLRDTSRPGFFMPLDGDDLLNTALVTTLYQQPSEGLLFDGGLILNAGTGALGETAKRTLSAMGQKPFWKFCGSCMVLPVGGNPQAECDFFAALALHEHRLYPYLAELAGYRLRRCADPMAVYIINHGENFETRRGRGGFKQRFVARFPVSNEKAEALEASAFPDLSKLRQVG